jgi:hypothetical protein
MTTFDAKKFYQAWKEKRKKEPNEEELMSEIENILVRIYATNLTLMLKNGPNAKKPKPENIEKYKSDMHEHSFKGKKHNLIILKILGNKVSQLVRRLKEGIYENYQYKSLRVQYFEMKKHVEKNKKKIILERKPTSRGNDFETNNIPLQVVDSLPVYFKKTIDGDNADLVEVLGNVVVDMKRFVIALTKSAQQIQHIFTSNLAFLNEEDNEGCDLSKMHKEEYSAAIKDDEFLKACVLRYRDKSNISEEFEFEILIYEVLPEVNRLLKCVEEELKRIHEESIKNIEMQNKGEKAATKIKIISNRNEDIDDLLNYINTVETESNSINKGGKKKNRQKKMNQNQNYNTNNSQISESNNIGSLKLDKEKLNKELNEEIELEIEEFENSLKTNSLPACSIKKIKPNLSKDWINNIC